MPTEAVRVARDTAADPEFGPWLAQAACMPAYRAIGDLMAERDMQKITQRF